MKFPKLSKIERLVSKDPTQRVLNNPWLNVELGAILSSSGQNAVVIPVEVEPGDTSGPVPIDAIKEIRRDGTSMSCTSEACTLPNGVAHPRDQKFTQYPPVQQLMTSGAPCIKIQVNAKQLLELAQALGTDVVMVKIPVQDTIETPSGPVVAKTNPAAPLVVYPVTSEKHVAGAMGAMLQYRVVQ